MTIREIITKHLEDNDFDGLCGDQCGCFINGLFPCGEGLNPDACVPGYKRICPGEENCPNSDECPTPNSGVQCMSTKKF